VTVAVRVPAAVVLMAKVVRRHGEAKQRAASAKSQLACRRGAMDVFTF
jgi:hypothetical protein